MADVFSKRKRSEVMSRIRSRGNKDTELALARLLRANGISGWRRHVVLKFKVQGSKFKVRGSTKPARREPRPTGRITPDFIFRKARLAVFVDGCFWHGCPKHATWPAHRAAWWRRKIEGNKTRDRVVNRTLRRAGRVKWRGHHAAGWRVVRIWECELAEARSQKSGVRSQKKATSRVVQRILEKLRVER